MKKSYDVVVYIGRMQPPTKAHIANINKALEHGNQVLVLLGSSFQPRTIKNPWKVNERASMLFYQLPPEITTRVTCRGIRDYPYNDQEWVQQIQKTVKRECLGLTAPRIAIIGCKKDESSYYLDMFPQWDLIEMEHLEDVNATSVRDDYFSGTLFNWSDKQLISDQLKEYLRKWMLSHAYTSLVNEYNFVKNYKEAWNNAPYPPIFVTVDAVVIQSGHVLLVQRKAAPGEGLWALPGGFVNQNETLNDAVIRELKEETKLKVPEPVLHGSIVGQKVFDHPGRSLRGRTITHAYVFKLVDGALNKVKGGDDAAKAKWFPIADVLEMEEFLFEDHRSIVEWGVNQC